MRHTTSILLTLVLCIYLPPTNTILTTLHSTPNLRLEQKLTQPRTRLKKYGKAKEAAGQSLVKGKSA